MDFCPSSLSILHEEIVGEQTMMNERKNRHRRHRDLLRMNELDYFLDLEKKREKTADDLGLQN